MDTTAAFVRVARRMAARRRQFLAIATLVALTTLLSSPTAQAVPLQWNVWINGVWETGGSNQGTPTGNKDESNYAASVSTDDLHIEYNLLADPDPYVIGNIVVTNITGFTNDYTVTVSLPITPIGSPSFTGGSVAGTLTTEGPGTLSTIGPGSSYYTAIIDGVDFKQLLPHAQSTSLAGTGSAAIGPADFGLPFLTFLGPAITSTIGIRLDFRLTAGDQAGFTSVFAAQEFPIPEPSTWTLLAIGLAGLAWSARRRAR